MMPAITVQAVTDRLGAELHREALSSSLQAFSDVSTDTRSTKPGDMFVALKGDRFDAHNFIEDAVQKRASVLVVEKLFPELNLPQIVVRDTTKALGEIAKLNRQQFKGPLIGVTGSCGKTTVKTLIYNILAESKSVLATDGSLNNHIGVPLTLFRLNSSHECSVIEMGASAPKEIDYLSKVALPSVALVTNAMLAHVEGFGSIEGVAKSKGEIYANLSEDGVAVVNWDDPYRETWLKIIGKRKVISFSVSPGEGLASDATQRRVDFFASDLNKNSDGTFQFRLQALDADISVQLKLLGKHNVANAVAAAACAHCVGASLEDIKSGLEKSTAVSGRMQMHTGLNDSIVIDDSYNANPDSVKAAIDSLVRWQGNTILVLGDLGELGEKSESMHADLGRYAKSAGIEALLATGELSAIACREFGRGAEHFKSHKQIVERLNLIANKNSVILVKGSRSAHMESVVTQVIVDVDRKKANVLES